MTETRNSLRAAGFAFLFKRDRGEISRGLWIRGALAIAAAVVAGEAGWLVLSPYATGASKNLAMFGPMTLVAYVYLLLFAFGGLLAAISFYNLSAKRFRARGRPPALAGAVLIAALAAGIASALQPGSEGAISKSIVYGTVAVFLIAALWTIWELGVAPDRDETP